MSWLKKELIETTRQYKLIVVIFIFAFFAILEPLMIKMLPRLLGADLMAQGIDINLLVQAEASAGIKGFIGDVFQIVPVVLAFTFSGYFSKEITTQTLVMPLTKGATLVNVYISKLIVLIGVVAFGHLIAGLINFYYANLIFSGSPVPWRTFMINHVYAQLVVSHFLIVMLAIDVWMKKSIMSSLAALGYFFAMSSIVGFMGKYAKYSPLYLTKEAGQFLTEYSDNAPIAIISLFLFTAIIIIISIYKLLHMKVIS